MNTIVWTLTIWSEICIPDSFDFDHIEHWNVDWKKTVFFFWETNSGSSSWFIEESEKQLGEIYWYDISHSLEDSIYLTPSSYEEWIYEVASFEWEHITFDEIQKRFEEVAEVICIRECETSTKFWNKVVRVDFVF